MADDNCLLEKYDHLYEKFLMLRLISIAAVSVYEDSASQICRLLRRQHRDDLCRALEDLGTAIYWLRNEALDMHPTSTPASDSL